MQHPSEMNLAELRCLRESLGLTVRAMSAAIGRSYQTITRWEAGEDLSPESAAALADLVAYTEESVAALAAARPDVITTYLDDAKFREHVDTGSRVLSAAWHRQVARRAAEQCGARIVYPEA